MPATVTHRLGEKLRNALERDFHLKISMLRTGSANNQLINNQPLAELTARRYLKVANQLSHRDERCRLLVEGNEFLAKRGHSWETLEFWISTICHLCVLFTYARITYLTYPQNINK